MNSVFKPFLRKFVLVFFDDILVYSKSWDEHIQHLTIVLQTLRQHSLFAKKSKCSFASSYVDYLGHVISGQGVQADPQKIQDMCNWPTPKNVKGNYAWNSETENAFVQLKQAMTQTPVLALPKL